jgi:hypothetical protein
MFSSHIPYSVDLEVWIWIDDHLLLLLLTRLCNVVRMVMLLSNGKWRLLLAMWNERTYKIKLNIQNKITTS